MDILRIISIITTFFTAPDLFIEKLINKQFGKLISRYYSQDILYRFNKYQDISQALDPKIIKQVLQKASPTEIKLLEKDIRELQEANNNKLGQQIANDALNSLVSAIEKENKWSGKEKILKRDRYGIAKLNAPHSVNDISKFQSWLGTNPSGIRIGSTRSPYNRNRRRRAKPVNKPSGASPSKPTKTEGNGATPPKPTPSSETSPKTKSPQNKGSSGKSNNFSPPPTNVSQQFSREGKARLIGDGLWKLSSSWVKYGRFEPIANSVLGMLTIWVQSDKDPKHRWYGPYTYPYVNQDIWTAMIQARGKNGTGAGSMMWQYFLRSWLPSALRGWVVSHKDEFTKNNLIKTRAFIKQLTIDYAKTDRTKIVKSQLAFGEKQYQLAKQRAQARQQRGTGIKNPAKIMTQKLAGANKNIKKQVSPTFKVSKGGKKR